jgi:hypothetical protein
LSAVARSATPTSELKQWPSLRTVLACCAAAAIAVAIDAVFHAQQGYISRSPDYDGVGYLVTAQGAYGALRSLHLRTALHLLNSNIAPLWITVLTIQQFIFGEGTWQFFTARFWGVAPLLTLVYWIVRNRSSRSMAIAAVGLTALLPIASAGVRASSWEFFTGQAIYGEFWSLGDLRPDFFAIVMVLCCIVPLAERYRAPTLSTYLVSGAFAAAAVLAKPSTAPIVLVAWVLTLGVIWFWNRGRPGILRMTALAVIVMAVLITPWAVRGGISATIDRYYSASVTYKGAYSTVLDFPDLVMYFLRTIPTQLGHIEAWFVIAGSVLLTVALLRRQLELPEWIYGGLALIFYASLTSTTNKNVNVGVFFNLSLWIFFLAGASRLVSRQWPVMTTKRGSSFVLSSIAIYVVVIYGLGAVALANWPANETRSNAQLLSVTKEVAREMGRFISSGQCFAQAPGPGWPASLEYFMTDSSGRQPYSTSIDVDPSMPVSEYVAWASQCPAVISYREDIAQVAQMFVAFPVRQPYLRAVAQWVRSPDSGYTLDRSWQFTDIASNGLHTLGHYQGFTLTVDLFIRRQGSPISP